LTFNTHGVTPYTYLVDVLQRVDQHPTRRVSELTPRLSKPNFGDNPLRSDIDRLAEPTGDRLRPADGY
jgi:hypothetical protein